MIIYKAEFTVTINIDHDDVKGKVALNDYMNICTVLVLDKVRMI